MTIRDFPRALLLDDRVEALQLCSRGIANCINLRACSWTRHGSLMTDVVLALQQLPLLTDLEINSETHYLFKPEILTGFTHLRKISLIMPSRPIINLLPIWITATTTTLRHLTLICKSSTRVNDELLATLAPNLTNLEHLYLVGCPKVTHKGVLSVLASNTPGIRGLGMEGLSSTFDMVEFSQQCLESGALEHLRSITLTGPLKTSSHAWAQQVINLLSMSPLEMFHISTMGGEVGGTLSDELCEQIVSTHGLNLRRFSVDRMGISIHAIRRICQECTKLEELFVTANQDDMDALGSCLAYTRTLRSLHVKRPVGQGSDTAPLVSESQVLSMVNKCGSELQQIGRNTRVWQVSREVKRAADGSLTVERVLVPYELPEIPEQFLVIRT
ncbi:unnamed protein product [Somion occarium]